jgi:hypothetical protein
MSEDNASRNLKTARVLEVIAGKSSASIIKLIELSNNISNHERYIRRQKTDNYFKVSGLNE